MHSMLNSRLTQLTAHSSLLTDPPDPDDRHTDIYDYV